MVLIPKEKYRAFIFDMDGTMVDNMMVHHHAWQQKLQEMGLIMSLDEVMQKVHGINEEIIQRLFGDRYTAEEVRFHAADKERRYREIFRDSLQLVHGLPQLMQAVSEADISMAVGSAAPPENVDFVLDNLDIRHSFDAILHSGDVSKGKPDPEIYLKIMQQLKVSPVETIVFEDSVVGAKAAEHAGCELVIVTTTHQKEEFASIRNIIGMISDFTEIRLV